MIKKFLKEILRKLENGSYPDSQIEINRSDLVNQKVLSLLYNQYYKDRSEQLSFDDVGFKVYSQNNEDGILLYIFSLIGTTNRKSVEICAGDGIECNTANLIINHNWIGLLVDGNETLVSRAKNFYSKHPNTKYWPPRIINIWVTKTNVNQLIIDNGFEGQIDLLSLDIDGVDYWIWKEINCILPRVVVVEFNHLWGNEKAVTVPYSDNIVAEFTEYGSDYAGASLMAFVKLGREKGYRLVGTNSISTNAFFIRNDIKCEFLKEIRPDKCFKHPRAIFGMVKRFPHIKDMEWIEV